MSGERDFEAELDETVLLMKEKKMDWEIDSNCYMVVVHADDGTPVPAVQSSFVEAKIVDFKIDGCDYPRKVKIKPVDR